MFPLDNEDGCANAIVCTHHTKPWRAELFFPSTEDEQQFTLHFPGNNGRSLNITPPRFDISTLTGILAIKYYFDSGYTYVTVFKNVRDYDYVPIELKYQTNVDRLVLVAIKVINGINAKLALHTGNLLISYPINETINNKFEIINCGKHLFVKILLK